MKNEKPWYRPLNENTDINNLVCANCGTLVPINNYNKVTELAKCQECGHLFPIIANDIKEDELVSGESSKLPNLKGQYNMVLLILIFILVLLVVLFFLKN